jgi:hypothetical protein
MKNKPRIHPEPVVNAERYFIDPADLWFLAPI